MKNMEEQENQEFLQYAEEAGRAAAEEHQAHMELLETEGMKEFYEYMEEFAKYMEEEHNSIKPADRTEIQGKYTQATVFTHRDLIEDRAYEQVKNITNSAIFKDSTIRVMPDIHAGKGSVIGMTVAQPPIVPSLVGVDIGCGVMVAEIGQIEDLDLPFLDKVVHETVPSGASIHNKKIHGFKKKIKQLKCYTNIVQSPEDLERFENSLGTLGSGNHFLELGLDEKYGSYYLSVHTGSRGLGYAVARHYIKLAEEKGYEEIARRRLTDNQVLINTLKKRGEEQLIESGLAGVNKYYNELLAVDKSLAALPPEDARNYLHDLLICQEFAHLNRKLILDSVLKKAFKIKLKDCNTFESVHNYHDLEKNIIRKGAVSANEGEVVLTALNIKDGIVMGVGRGNPNWNYSAPHGAGRQMSRTQALATFNKDDLQQGIGDVYSSTLTANNVDEIPQAYKPKESILDNVEETMDIVTIFQPVYNYKG